MILCVCLKEEEVKEEVKEEATTFQKPPPSPPRRRLGRRFYERDAKAEKRRSLFLKNEMIYILLVVKENKRTQQ